MNKPIDCTLNYPSRKMPVLAANVVSTTQPLAAQAGVRMMLAGGNAVDAAIATAITLTVVEPVMNGIGGDMFALVWHEGQLYGLNACGRSPAAWTPEFFAGHDAMPPLGWGTVTVPGAVSGWKALSDRFGVLPFAKLFEPAIEYARNGFPVSPTVARQWSEQAPRLAEQPGYADAFLIDGRTPVAGEIWKFEAQARTLESIAASGGESFYRGELAQRIAEFSKQGGGGLTAQDLDNHKVDWVQPISQSFGDLRLHEIPPNGQGIAALLALGMLEKFDLASMGRDSADYYHVCIEAMKLSFADLHHHIADEAHMRVDAAALLDPEYLAGRAKEIRMDVAAKPSAGSPSTGGTVYLTAADAKGTMISFIQSNYHGFGSGVVVPGTGIALHNRGRGFVLTPGHANQVAPNKRPLHTIIPGFVTRAGKPLMSFGVMGGSMQAQGHMQMVTRLGAFGQNPQDMCDAPRFRVEAGPVVSVESHMPPAVVEELRRRGHNVEVAPPNSLEFGSAQLIYKQDGAYFAASDSRRDGHPAGF